MTEEHGLPGQRAGRCACERDQAQSTGAPASIAQPFQMGCGGRGPGKTPGPDHRMGTARPGALGLCLLYTSQSPCPPCPGAPAEGPGAPSLTLTSGCPSLGLSTVSVRLSHSLRLSTFGSV